MKGLKSEKTTFRENTNNIGFLNNLLNKQLKQKNKVKQKVNTFKGNNTKVIDLLRV